MVAFGEVAEVFLFFKVRLAGAGDTHKSRKNDYSNPCCVCVLRVNIETLITKQINHNKDVVSRRNIVCYSKILDLRPTKKKKEPGNPTCELIRILSTYTVHLGGPSTTPV